MLYNQWIWTVIVFLFGSALGCSELIARYRDAPFGALSGAAARLYIIINGLAASFAYILIVKFDWSFGAGDTQKAWVQALVAGFGSMVFFRSSLLTMKVGESDVAVGPGILFQILLFAADRECDRRRAAPRSNLVTTIMRGVSFEQARDALPSFCFELMQNVPANEQQQFRQVVDALSTSKMRDTIKSLNLGLMLINVVGERVLEAAVRALGEKIQGPAKLELDVFASLQNVDFGKAFPLLVDVCFIMSKYGTANEQSAAKSAIIEEIEAVKAKGNVDNATKMTLLGLALQQRVGDAVLLAALAHVADGIQIGAKPPAAESDQPSLPAGVVPLHAQDGQPFNP